MIIIEIILIILFLGPNLFGLKTFVVTSGSMEPLYPVGSLIYVKKVNPEEIKVNDAITFYMPDGNIIATHQVYDIDEDKQEFRTQGINNKDDNGNIIHDGEPVKFSSVIGKPILCIKYLGYINRLITSRPIIYFIFLVTIIIILINYILEKKMEVSKMKSAKRLKQSNRKTTFSIILVTILLVLVLGGTIAWLTKTSSVSNIFTVGSFENPSTSPIDPETPIDIEGNIYEPNWNAEEEHKLIPDATFEKDPYVGIGAGSEDATVYVYVENSFSNKVYFTINQGWEAIEATEGFKEGTYTSGLFKYTPGLKNATDADVWTSQPLFSNVVTDETATIDDFKVTDPENLEIIVSSFLHQTKSADGTEIPEKTIEDAAKKAFGIV